MSWRNCVSQWRKIVVQANVTGRDLRSVFEDVKSRIEQKVKLPEGYYVEYGGQFESEAEATKTIGLLSIVSLLFIILHHEEPVVLMKEVLRVLKPNGILAVIHRNYDPKTPHAPAMSLRPCPEQCIAWG